MKALIMLAEGFEDLEFWYPLMRLKEQGIDVDVAAPRPGKVTGKHGYTYDVRLAVGGLSAEDYDILVIPGGRAPELIRLDEMAVAITRDMMQAGKIVAAICHGGQVLVSADIIRGKRVTGWKGIRDDLKAAGGRYVDREVVVDGNLVTSRCPDDLPAFMRETLALAEKSVALAGAV